MKASKFFLSITIHNAFVSVDFNSSISVTVQYDTYSYQILLLMPANHLPKYCPFFLNRPVWRCGDNGDRRGTVKIRLWNFNEHTFWHKYTTLYSPSLYRASICAWRIFSPGTTMAGRVRDLRRGAGLPPTGFTSGATPAHPLLQENMMRGYALRDQWPLCVRYPS